jgi:hypothetical protein
LRPRSARPGRRELLELGFGTGLGVGAEGVHLPLLSSDVQRATRASRRPSVAAMDWPPQPGELLPRAEEAVGVREKLSTYSLLPSHPEGGPKARGFAQILGITLQSIAYLEDEIYSRIRITRISSVRPNPPHGINCVVQFSIRGVGPCSGRIAPLRTVWEFESSDSPPRLISAFLKP